jgi:hypothetical protein
MLFPSAALVQALALLVLSAPLRGGSIAFSQPQTSVQPPSTSGDLGRGQTPPATPSPQEKINDLAEIGSYKPGVGTVILAELTKSLDVAHLHPGDGVECSVIQDLLYKGKIIVPHGAKVIGRVTEARTRTKEQTESHLGIIFYSIVLKNKKELSFQQPAFIQAVAAPILVGSVPTTRPSDMPIFMPKGSTTGGAVIDALSANASLAGANMPSTSGAISAANRGVIGLPELALDPANSVIISRKSNVKLPTAAQLLLRVTDPPQGR